MTSAAAPIARTLWVSAIFLAAEADSAALRELMTMLAPTLARALAICRPRPLLPPVIQAVLPWSLKSSRLILGFFGRLNIARTGVALIIVDESGEKSIGACMGANHKLTAADVRRAKEALSSCRVLLMQFEAPDVALVVASNLARKGGAKVVLDPAPPRKIPKE